MKRLLILGFLIALVPAVAQGQLKEQTAKKFDFAKILTAPARPQGLFGMLGLSPDRFSMQQSYSLSFVNFGGQSYSQGLYLNTMQYQVSDPLRVSVQWGLLNQPFGSFGAQPLTSNRLFLSSAGVYYQPSRNFSFEVQYQALPYRYFVPSYDFSSRRPDPDR